MGRPIKIAKAENIDTGYTNAIGLGVVGGDGDITGPQIGCRFNVDGTVRLGYIVRQKGARKFFVSTNDNLYSGICVLADTATPDFRQMSVSITTATAGTKFLRKFNDVLGETFDGQVYFLTMNVGGQSATPPFGSQFQIAAIQLS